MISILVPTRKRPELLRRLVESVRSTASWRVEIFAYITPDDTSYEDSGIDANFMVGPRQLLGHCWNALAKAAAGDLLMLGNDDIVFRTPGWDAMVLDEFKRSADKILMVYGDDLGCHRARFGPHPIIHRRWVETVGYFVPGEFAGNYTDTWLNDVARAIGRDRFLPFVCEHMHPLFNKMVPDETAQERVKMESEQNWTAKYEAMAPQRAADVEKLRAVMAQ